MSLSNANIAMNIREIDCLSKYMLNAEKYFEFGCGGSTININKYYDSDNCIKKKYKTKAGSFRR